MVFLAPLFLIAIGWLLAGALLAPFVGPVLRRARQSCPKA